MRFEVYRMQFFKCALSVSPVSYRRVHSPKPPSHRRSSDRHRTHFGPWCRKLLAAHGTAPKADRLSYERHGRSGQRIPAVPTSSRGTGTRLFCPSEYDTFVEPFEWLSNKKTTSLLLLLLLLLWRDMLALIRMCKHQTDAHLLLTWLWQATQIRVWLSSYPKQAFFLQQKSTMLSFWLSAQLERLSK